METLEGDVYGPGFSLSEDADTLERTALEKRKREHVAMEEAEVVEGAEVEEDDGDTDYSFEFSSTVSLDLPPENKMLSAEELFFNGKLRPFSGFSEVRDEDFSPLVEKNEDHRSRISLVKEKLHHLDKEFLPFVEKKNRSPDVKQASFSGSLATMDSVNGEKACYGDVQNRPILPTVKTSLHESLALAKQHLQSLHESPRCLSMTVEGSRGRPRRSCVSLSNSRCSSPSRSRPSGTFSQPPTTPTSPKATSSSQKSSKFLHFFKLKKHLNSNKEALFLSSESFAASGSRLSRAFWPFSRSNSAGESKSAHGVLPLPRRSNSAGESKTTSSSLLPNNATRRNGEIKGENTTASLMAFARKSQVVQSNQQQADKKGLPPLLNPNLKKTSSCFVPTNCGSDSVALSQLGDGTPSTLAPTSIPSFSCESTSSPSLSCVSTSSPSLWHAPTCASRAQSSSLQNGEGDHTHADSASMLKEYKAALSPGRHVRNASATNPMRNLARGSPARQWSNPNMGGSTRSLQRFGPPPRALVRPKDVLSGDTATVRVVPVLNVPACMTPSSKSKLFNLGNLFSKKEKAARGYTMLASTDSQSGG
eukprot:c22072_g1_i1 orf=578-2350(+)